MCRDIFDYMLKSLPSLPSAAWAVDTIDDLAAGVDKKVKSGVQTPNCYVSVSGEILCIELPGCKKDDIQLNVDGGRITVSASRELLGKKTEYGVVLKRFGNASFDNVKAAYENGILTIKCASKPKESTKIQIE